MSAAARAKVGNGGLGQSVEQQRHNTTETRYAKLATPLSSHSTGVRRRIGGSAHGGAGGDGGTVDWKSCQAGRRLGGGSSASGAGTGMILPRLQQPTISSSLRAASNRTAPKQQREKAAATVAAIINKHDKPTNRTNKTNKAIKWEINDERKRVPPTPSAGKDKSLNNVAKQATRARLWQQPQVQRKFGGAAAIAKKEKSTPRSGHVVKAQSEFVGDAIVDKMSEVSANPPNAASFLLETGIQTNEAEILNHQLLVGNVKLIKPSQQLVERIEKFRKETKIKEDKLALRKFAPHEHEEEIHLTELKEFSERNFVTKRATKKPSLSYANYDQSIVFRSMDEFLSREVPRAESITNIKERIKRKEHELMSLFDGVNTNEQPPN